MTHARFSPAEQGRLDIHFGVIDVGTRKRTRRRKPKPGKTLASGKLPILDVRARRPVSVGLQSGRHSPDAAGGRRVPSPAYFRGQLGPVVSSPENPFCRGIRSSNARSTIS